MKRFSEIVAEIRATLSVTEPRLDTTVGQTPRRMIDAFSEALAEAYVDSALQSYVYDVDTRIGADLDDFLANFGFYRRLPQRATGTIVLERQGSLNSAIIVPIGTRVGTNEAPAATFETVVGATCPIGETTVSAPIQAVRGGADGNVSSGAITRGISGAGLSGFNSISNPDATSGGRDAESDDAFRRRFKRTVFRNLAGVEEMFIGVALENPHVTNANALGVSKRYFERVEVIGGSATSTLTSARYIYPNKAFFGPDIQGGAHFVPGVHFDFDHTLNPPTITVLNPATVPDGIYDLDYAYIPEASRNDPDSGITNRIDVYLTGEQIVVADETLVFRTAAAFNTTSGSQYNRANFRRADNTQPVAGNYFIRFGFAPVTDPSISGTITIGGNTYTEGVDFWLVNDITPEGGGATSLSGIELRSIANGGSTVPADNTVFTTNYLFNGVVRDVEDAISRWRLMTTDVKVHAAKKRRFAMYFALLLVPGYTLAQVKPDIESNIRSYLMEVGFNGVIQTSDLIEIVHGVSGVDAVRLMTSGDDGSQYAIQEVTPAGSIITVHASPAPGTRRATDIHIAEDEEPVLYNVGLIQKAQNSWSTGA